ncbi:MAG: ABC transporter ATP-binding protein [Promethearchaeota archaeon]
MPKPIIIRGLTKIFNKNTNALQNINLTIPSGKVFGILGPNGAGKTTFFRILANSLEPDSGKIFYGDKEITNNRTWAKRNIRYCPQDPVFYEFLTVYENLELLSELNNIPPVIYHSRINKLLKNLNMEDKRNKNAKTLSSGQKKRLSIMIALLTEPTILLLDEPTAGLDISARRVLKRWLGSKKISIILSTHNFLEAQNYCDEIAVLNYGKLLYSGTINSITGSTSENKKLSLENALKLLTDSSLNNSKKRNSGGKLQNE